MAPSSTHVARPLVSIVTPTLNRRDLLATTIRSVRGQTHRPIEHVVIDGGSTDGTIGMLRELAEAADPAVDPEYRLRWVSEPDRGMYDAVDKGLRMTQGSVVAYLNSDDRYFPWTVERAVAALEATAEADLVFGDVLRVDALRGITVPVFQPRLHVTRMAAYGTLFQPAVVMRRRVAEELGGFDDSLRYVADLDFWLRAATRFRLLQIDEFLALEHRHAEMLSETARDSMAVEDAGMRARYRSGVWARPVGPVIGKIEWHAWSAARWLAFVAAARGHGRGWERTIAACGPRVAIPIGALGTLPSKGSRFRSGIAWTSDPQTVAEA